MITYKVIRTTASPITRVQIGYNVHRLLENTEEFVSLTSPCALESEIDECVDGLIEQLNKVREKAKRDLEESPGRAGQGPSSLTP